MNSTYPLVPIANFLAMLLIIVPLGIKVVNPYNIGVFMLAVWISLEALFLGINAIVWSNSVDDFAPTWCDISSRISIASNVGIPACSLVITRQLYTIISLREFDSGSKRREFLIGLSICLALPLLSVALYYIVQGARYSIYESYGCASAVSAIGMSDLLLDAWQILIPSISVCLYTPLGMFDALVTLPLNILAMVTNASQAGSFWPGWNTVHEDPSIIAQVPTCVWSADFWARFALQESRWINVILAIMFFALFGLAPEARGKYRRAVCYMLGIFGVKRRPSVGKGSVSAINFESFERPEQV